VVGGTVEVGRTVQFHLRDVDAADADLRRTLRTVLSDGRLDTVEGALLVTCDGRGAAFFGSSAHDAVVLGEVLGRPPVAGFFAAGELGPVAGRSHVHGHSAVVLAFGSGSGADRGTAMP
jgi:small ligand-binding sensory domain FIST